MQNDKFVMLAWMIVLLPYEIGLLFMLFGSATLVQVLFYGTLCYVFIFVLRAFFRHPLTALFGIILGSKI